MSKKVEASGSCLCGAIKLVGKTVDTGVGACHCRTCRGWGGGPFLTVDCGTEVTIEGEENVSVFDSSEWAERGFCKLCGTHLFYRLKSNGQYIAAAGLFGDGIHFEMDHQVFVDQRPSYYCFSNKTHEMTGAEVFAMFAPTDE